MIENVVDNELLEISLQKNLSSTGCQTDEKITSVSTEMKTNVLKVNVKKEEHLNTDEENISDLKTVSQAEDRVLNLKEEPDARVKIKEEQNITSEIKEELEKSFIDNDVHFDVTDISNSNNKEECNDNNVNSLIKNLKDFLHSESNGKSNDRKKLGESLLNAFAVALNLDELVTPKKSVKSEDASKQIGNIEKEKKSNASQSTKTKGKLSFIKNVESKLKLQPIKLASMEKLHMKNLKSKSETEKNTRGPLKATIPVKNMENSKSKNIDKASPLDHLASLIAHFL